jgi:hypothetical protein
LRVRTGRLTRGISSAKLFGNAEYLRLEIADANTKDWHIKGMVAHGGPKDDGSFLKSGTAPLLGYEGTDLDVATGKVGDQLQR